MRKLFNLSIVAWALIITGCALPTTPASNTATVTAAVSTATSAPAATPISTPIPIPTAEAITATRVSGGELLGIITIPNDTVVSETPVGGLSALAYDAENAVYYFLSDDRATLGPVRIYQASIDLSDDILEDGDL